MPSDPGPYGSNMVSSWRPGAFRLGFAVMAAVTLAFGVATAEATLRCDRRQSHAWFDFSIESDGATRTGAAAWERLDVVTSAFYLSSLPVACAEWSATTERLLLWGERLQPVYSDSNLGAGIGDQHELYIARFSSMRYTTPQPCVETATCGGSCAVSCTTPPAELDIAVPLQSLGMSVRSARVHDDAGCDASGCVGADFGAENCSGPVDASVQALFGKPAGCVAFVGLGLCQTALARPPLSMCAVECGTGNLQYVIGVNAGGQCESALLPATYNIQDAHLSQSTSDDRARAILEFLREDLCCTTSASTTPTTAVTATTIAPQSCEGLCNNTGVFFRHGGAAANELCSCHHTCLTDERRGCCDDYMARCGPRTTSPTALVTAAPSVAPSILPSAAPAIPAPTIAPSSSPTPNYCTPSDCHQTALNNTYLLPGGQRCWCGEPCRTHLCCHDFESTCYTETPSSLPSSMPSTGLPTAAPASSSPTTLAPTVTASPSATPTMAPARSTSCAALGCVFDESSEAPTFEQLLARLGNISNVRNHAQFGWYYRPHGLPGALGPDGNVFEPIECYCDELCAYISDPRRLDANPDDVTDCCVDYFEVCTPTAAPSRPPTSAPSISPTPDPSAAPTSLPSLAPTTSGPTAIPTTAPSSSVPSVMPTSSAPTQRQHYCTIAGCHTEGSLDDPSVCAGINSADANLSDDPEAAADHVGAISGEACYHIDKSRRPYSACYCHCDCHDYSSAYYPCCWDYEEAANGVCSHCPTTSTTTTMTSTTTMTMTTTTTMTSTTATLTTTEDSVRHLMVECPADPAGVAQIGFRVAGLRRLTLVVPSNGLVTLSTCGSGTPPVHLSLPAGLANGHAGGCDGSDALGCSQCPDNSDGGVIMTRFLLGGDYDVFVYDGLPTGARPIRASLSVGCTAGPTAAPSAAPITLAPTGSPTSSPTMRPFECSICETVTGHGGRYLDWFEDRGRWMGCYCRGANNEACAQTGACCPRYTVCPGVVETGAPSASPTSAAPSTTPTTVPTTSSPSLAPSIAPTLSPRFTCDRLGFVHDADRPCDQLAAIFDPSSPVYQLACRQQNMSHCGQVGAGGMCSMCIGGYFHHAGLCVLRCPTNMFAVETPAEDPLLAGIGNVCLPMVDGASCSSAVDACVRCFHPGCPISTLHERSGSWVLECPTASPTSSPIPAEYLHLTAPSLVYKGEFKHGLVEVRVTYATAQTELVDIIPVLRSESGTTQGMLNGRKTRATNSLATLPSHGTQYITLRLLSAVPDGNYSIEVYLTPAGQGWANRLPRSSGRHHFTLVNEFVNLVSAPSAGYAVAKPDELALTVEYLAFTAVKFAVQIKCLVHPSERVGQHRKCHGGPVYVRRTLPAISDPGFHRVDLSTQLASYIPVGVPFTVEVAIGRFDEETLVWLETRDRTAQVPLTVTTA